MIQDYRMKLSSFQKARLNGTFIKEVKGGRNPNVTSYFIDMHDHTIGDLLSVYLLKNKDVKYSGYKVPHPLDVKLEVKV